METCFEEDLFPSAPIALDHGREVYNKIVEIGEVWKLHEEAPLGRFHWVHYYRLLVVLVSVAVTQLWFGCAFQIVGQVISGRIGRMERESE